MIAPKKKIETTRLVPSQRFLLSQEAERHRRRRSLAIALALGALAAIFFVVTIVRIGGAIPPHAM